MTIAQTLHCKIFGSLYLGKFLKARFMPLCSRLVSFLRKASVAVHYKGDVSRNFATFQDIVKEIANATSLSIPFTAPKHYLPETQPKFVCLPKNSD